MRTLPARLLLASALSLAAVPILFGHIRIYPTESAFGAREKYTMRVPNEKQVDSIRVEGEFPADLNVYDFEFKPGWKIDLKKDDKGKITGATWTGRIQPYEFIEFGMLGIYPKRGAGQGVGLEIRSVLPGRLQRGIHRAGGSRLPSPVVALK